MITTKRYPGDKILQGDFKTVDVKNQTRASILYDILVLDVVNFYYQGGKIAKGKKHDKIPQLLVLGSVSKRYSGAKNMGDRITGLNLHYLSQGEVNAIMTKAKNLYEHRISAPQFVTDTILKGGQFGRAYRQYLTSQIFTFHTLYTLGSYLDVRKELDEEGSFEDKQKEKNERILAELGLSFNKTTRRFRNKKTGRFEKPPTSILDDLGYNESDLYK